VQCSATCERTVQRSSSKLEASEPGKCMTAIHRKNKHLTTPVRGLITAIEKIHGECLARAGRVGTVWRAEACEVQVSPRLGKIPYLSDLQQKVLTEKLCESQAEFDLYTPPYNHTSHKQPQQWPRPRTISARRRRRRTRSARPTTTSRMSPQRRTRRRSASPSTLTATL
jgi:hypothetical protein